jgi:hypothetical protein
VLKALANDAAYTIREWMGAEDAHRAPEVGPAGSETAGQAVGGRRL